MRFRFVYVGVFVCALVFAAGAGFTRDDSAGRVVRVSSGDTLWIRQGGVNRKVRIYGIRAPERGQPYYARAREALRRYIGKRRVYIRARGKSAAGTLRAHVYLQGVRGRNSAGRFLAAAGWAWVLPGRKGEASYRPLQKRARAKRLGLWRGKNPVPPWLFKPGTGHGCKIQVVKPKCK